MSADGDFNRTVESVLQQLSDDVNSPMAQITLVERFELAAKLVKSANEVRCESIWGREEDDLEDGDESAPSYMELWDAFFGPEDYAKGGTWQS